MLGCKRSLPPMVKISIKQICSSSIALGIAVILTGFGVVLFLHANLGSDTITVFIDGLKTKYSLSLGTASRIYNIGALLLAYLLSRKDIGWTSILYALSTGYAMDLFDYVVSDFTFLQSSMIARICMVLIGQCCIIISFALLIRFGKGMDQLDAIAYGITKRRSLRYAYVRTLLDVILIVLGAWMGGTIGIGSVIAMSTTGIGIDWLLQMESSLCKRTKNTIKSNL